MSTARRNKAFAERVVATLIGQGLTDALICPGSRSTPLALALDDRSEITAHSVLDERAAGFIALGIGRMRGKAALVCCTSGSAAAHLLPAVVEARQSRVPLLVLSADRPRELQSCGAPQTIDQTHLFGRQARWFFDFGAAPEDRSTDWIETIALQAWLRAHGPAGGAVHLNLPLAEPLWSPELEGGPTAAAPHTATVPRRILRGSTCLPDEALEWLCERLRATERGLIVCGPVDPAPLGGALALSDGTFSRAVEALSTALGWPLVADPYSQLRFRSARPAHLVTSADALSRSREVRRALAPELVLRLGQVPTSKALGQWLGEAGQGKTILVDDSGRWQDPHHCGDTLVFAEPTELCRALALKLTQQRPPSAATRAWQQRWQTADQLATTRLREAAAEGLWEPGVVTGLLDRLAAGTLLHVASSMPIRDLDTFGDRAAGDLILLSNRGANGIDGLVATAAGEALAAGTAHAVLLCGDLAFLHDVGGLAAAAQLPVELTVVLLDNRGGGIFEYLEIAAHPTAFRERFLTPQQTRPADLCAAVGARYLPVTQHGELADALPAALNQQGLSVIHVHIDRATSVARHHETFSTIDRALTECAQRWNSDERGPR